jgi:hypothetical protein
MQFEYGLQYEALLQVIEGDEYLCNGVNDTEGWSPGLVVGPKKHDARRHPGGGVHNNMFDGGIEGIEEIRVLEEGKIMNDTDKVHVVPSNGVPGTFFFICRCTPGAFHSLLGLIKIFEYLQWRY